jgi:hypothetical protein
MTSGRERGHDDLELAPPSHDTGAEALEKRAIDHHVGFGLSQRR